MKTGQRVKVRYSGKEYIGEVIRIRQACNCLIFMIDCLPITWLSKGDIVL